MDTVVKRQGHKEPFDEKKVYGSVYAACANAHFGENDCEKVAEEVTNKITEHFKNLKEIDSTDIRKKVITELKKKDEELAFYYEQNLPNLKKL